MFLCDEKMQSTNILGLMSLRLTNKWLYNNIPKQFMPDNLLEEILIDHHKCLLFERCIHRDSKFMYSYDALRHSRGFLIEKLEKAIILCDCVVGYIFFNKYFSIRL